MGQPFIPKLAAAFKNKLRKLMEISIVLAIPIHPEVEPDIPTENFDQVSLLSLFKAYMMSFGNYQRLMLNTSRPEFALLILENQLSQFGDYAERYIQLFGNLAIETTMPEVKLTQRIDPMAILADLQNENYLEAPMREYARLVKSSS